MLLAQYLQAWFYMMLEPDFNKSYRNDLGLSPLVLRWDTALFEKGKIPMAEDEPSEADLSGRLATVLEEIRDVMEKRKQRIEELRQEITEIENDNDDLEKTISELLDSFG